MQINSFAQNNADLQLSIIEFPKVIKQNAGVKIKFLVSNVGKAYHNSVIVNYAIDGVVIASKNIDLKIADQENQSIALDYVFDLFAKEHQLKIWLTDQVNNMEIKTINSLAVDFLVARTTVPQLPLVEEFTSSTCGPCASFNSTFDPFLSSINANKDGGQAAAVKYQMNWPSPDNDPSYNSDGNGRRTFYAVSGIPKSFLNGTANTSFNQSVIDAASGESAFKLVPYFYISGDTVKATCTATSYTNMSTSLKLQMALTEDYYAYTGGTTSQTTFYYAMRKMFPNYVGTVISNIHEDTTYTSNKNYKVTYGNVTQNSFNIWGTSAGFTLVAWIQNTTTKEVYQAAFANTPSALNLSEQLKNSFLEVFPNPAEESFTIKLNLNEQAQVTYTLTDVTGKMVQQPIVKELPAGKHVLQTSTENLLAGVYFCTIKANGQSFTERIMVTK
jgi:hypothetical protein